MDVFLAWFPTGWLPWSYTRAVHFVDLLEAETFGLGDEQPHVEKAESEHAKENKQNEWADVACDTRGKEREQEVPYPVLSF